jgi:CheY-like chemotaxis protein
MATILIVDDERITVELISTALSLHGHQPLAAHSGQQALDMIAENTPDLVLLDLMMPGLDGYQTLERLRETPNGAQVPVVIMTATEDEELEERVRAAGGNGVLRKPIHMDMILAAIAEQVEHD